MNIGTLTLEMAANVARLRADMGQAKSTVSGAMEVIKGRAADAAKALSAIGIGMAVIGAGRYLYGLAMDAASAQAKLKDLAEVTGATVEWLSAIRTTAKLTGTEMEAIGGGLTKLGKNIETGSEEAAKGLKAIGLNIDQLKGLRPDEQFDKVAKALNGFADGAGKSAAAQLILGKAGAQLLPFIKDYGELTEFNVKVTAKQAQQADDLEKDIKRLTAAKEAWKKIVGAELVPVLGDLVKVLLKTQTETNGTLNTTKALAKDGSIKTWAQEAALGFAMVIDMGLSTGHLLKRAALETALFFVEIGAAAAKVDAFLKPTQDLPKIIAAQWASYENDIRKRIGDMNSSTFDIGKTQKDLRAQFAMTEEAGKHMWNWIPGAKGQITGLASDTKTAGETIVMTFTKIMMSIDDRIKGERSLLDSGKKLTAAEEFALQIQRDLATTNIKYTDSQKAQIAAALQKLKTLEDENEAKKHLIKAQKRQNEEDEKSFEIEEKKRAAKDEAIKSLRELIEQTQLETRLVGLSNEERIISTALLKAQAAGIDTTTEAWAKLVAELRKAVYSKKEQEDLVKANEDAVNAQKQAWESLNGTVQGFFEDLFKNGRSAFGNLWQTVKSFFAQVAAKFATKFILQTVLGLGGDGGGLLGGLLGGGGGAGGGILGGLLGGSGGILGGILSSVVGPGSAIGTFLGMSSAVGPPAALAAGGAAGGGLLGLLGPIGIIAGIGAMLYNLFGKDEKGIKFDNSVQGVGNPSSHWEQNPISQWDISGDLSRKDVAPFADRINKFDKWLADNLLTPASLEAARASLQAVKNPRWWNLEDKQAVEKASKYFLQERYGIIFGEIDEGVASMIRSFQGSADELLAFIESAAQMVEPFKQLQAAMPSLNLSLSDFLDLTESQRAAIVQLADTLPLLMTDSMQEVDRLMREAGRGSVEAFRLQGDAMDELAQQFIDGKITLEQFTAAGANMASAYAQVTAKIVEVQMTLDGLFSDAREGFQLQGMTPKQQYDYFQQQADKLYANLGAATDPEEIERLTRKIIDYMNRANALLSDEDRVRLSGKYVDGVDRVETLANERLREATRQAGVIADKIGDTMEAAFAQWTKDQKDIADQTRQTVDNFGDNVDRMPRTLDIRIDSPVPVSAEVN